MTKPCILCCAITGSLPTKANNPAVPISIAEQVESSHEAFEAGRRVDPHWALDMRLGWKVRRDLELSIVGQNLLDRRHLEAINEPLPSIVNEIERGVYLRADWRL